MGEQIENYVNWFPWGYAYCALLMFFCCGYSLVWTFNDMGMFGSRFYRRRLIRSALGLVCAITIIGWPIPLLAWIVFSVPAWFRHESELDQVLRYERKQEVRWVSR